MNDDYPLLDLFWTMLWFFLFIAWLFLLFTLFADIFRSKDMGGWAKALWYSRKIDTARVIILGVLAKYRRSGVGELLELEMMVNAEQIGIKHAEFSWILEDNMVMRTALERMGATVYRTYRMYDVPIGAGANA